MPSYRYMSTDLITGKLLADSLPLEVQSCGRVLNGTGTLTGYLDLQQPFTANAPFIAALEARRAVIWVLQDGYPVWCGPCWDWPHQSILDGKLPVAAQTMESVFDKRLITATLQYKGADLFAVFADLLMYGLTKSSPYITSTGGIPAPSSLVTSAAKVARIVLPSGAAAVSGVPWTGGYTWSDFKKVSAAWQELAASGNLEYTLEPGLDSSGNLATFLRLGYTVLGRSVLDSGIALTYPGNVIDYGYQRTGSQSANYLWATAPPNGSAASWLSQYPHGADLGDLRAGYPLMEDTAAWNGSVVTQQAMVNGFADGQVQLRTQAMAQPVIKAGGGAAPKAKDIVLGDSCWFTATSALHPARPDGSPGLQQQVRISGWTLYPPGQQPEYIQVVTSGVVATQT